MSERLTDQQIKRLASAIEAFYEEEYEGGDSAGEIEQLLRGSGRVDLGHTTDENETYDIQATLHVSELAIYRTFEPPGLGAFKETVMTFSSPEDLVQTFEDGGVSFDELIMTDVDVEELMEEKGLL